jgi:hypothetical protein
MAQGRGALRDESGPNPTRSWQKQSAIWLKDPKTFGEVLTGVKFYNRAANVRFFGTPQNPGPLYKVVKNAIDIWSSFGKVKATVATPQDLINHSFVK